MIDAAFISAFESLVPVDQTLIAGIVFKLASQDKQISIMAREVNKLLDSNKDNDNDP